MLRRLTKNPLLPRQRLLLLLQPRRPCADATSSAAAGEIAPAPAANEAPLEDDLREESRSRLVRDICRLLELRDSWSAKREAQLRHLLRVLSPPQVRAVLRAQAQRDARAAFEFFRWADRQWKYRHAPEVFDEMLALLSRTRLHDPARRVMRLMIRRGMRRGTQQFAHLMLTYSRAGKLRSAMRVLQLMQKDGCAPDISICNVAVNVLVVAGRIDKALEFAERMRRVGVDPDVVTYNCLIKGLCEARRVVDALEMIGSMLQNGCPPDKISYFTVMSFLCKEKRVVEVRNLLERMRNDAGLFPDQVTYNMLIHVLAKHGHADEALGFLRESEGKRFRVDEVGYSAIVHSFCLNGRMPEAKEIVSEMISKGCRPDVVTYSAVVDGFCRIGELDQARKMMKHMYKNGCKPNTVTHTALLNGLCKVGKTSEAWELLNKSEEEWWTPSDITYSVVMHGFRREGKLKESCDVVVQMLQKGFFPTTVEINLLIHALCKEGKPAEAKDFMEQCQSKGCSINVVNFTTVIHGFSCQGDLESALSLLDDMYLTNRHPDVVTYTVVVDALGKKGKMKEATELVKKMLNRGLLPTPVTYRTVIHRYCERDKVEDLLILLDKMLARQEFSSAYNQVIEKLCAFDKLSEAYNLLSKVLRTASKRDAQTCHVLMESFLNKGLPLQSYNVACRMFQRNLIPDVKLCQKVDSQLALAGETQAAGKLIIKFVERGPGYLCDLMSVPDLQLGDREETMGEGSNVMVPLLDINESLGASEELLQREPVPWGVLAQLTAWEAGNLWRISWASILITLFSFMLSLITQMFVGHLGELELAGASITNIGIQGLAYGIMIGMASAVQTVCGQAYGARRYTAMGVVCQRALVLQLATAIPIAFLYWYAGLFLRLIGQEADVAVAGQLYARGLLPQLLAFALFCPMQRFLQAQNIVNPVAYITLAVLIFHTLASWLAVFVLGSGLLGAALTLSFSWWVLVVLTWGYIVCSPACKETWTGLSLLAFRGLWGYAKLTFASAIMLALEIWYVQGFVLLTGFLPNSEIALDSLSICINYWNWDFQIMLGLSYAASIRVGNELGAGHPKVARFSVIVVVMASIAFSIFVMLLVIILRYPLSTLYTSSTTVIEAVISLMPLLAFSIFLNGIQPILSGVAIGSGWQAIVAYVNVGAYYLIGLPIGCVLGYKTSLGAAGIWWGLIVGVSVQTIALIVLTARTNWDKEVVKAMQRLQQTGVIPVNDIIA